MEYQILADQIIYFPQAFKNPQDFLELVDRTETKSVKPWKPWIAQDGYDYGESKMLDRMILKEEDESTKEISEYIINQVVNCFTECTMKYAEVYNLSQEHIDFAIDSLENAKFGINRYLENRSMGPHVDWNEQNEDVCYVIILYINDDYDNGGIQFINHDVSIKPEAGSVLIFPGNHPFVHKTFDAQNGRKVLINHHLNIKVERERAKMKLAARLHENVYYYKNVIDNPQKLVDMIEENDSNEAMYPVIPKWGHWLSNSNDGHQFGGKKDFNPQNMDQLSPHDRNNAEYIVNTIRNAVSSVANTFIKDRELDITANISPYVGVCKYTTGCQMGAHFDAQGGDNSLQYSIVLYLNDDYEGGEISFVIRDYDLRDPQYSHLKPESDINHPDNVDRIDFWLKPEAGSALIFPSVHPYKHQVHLMKSGDKYIFPGFIFVDGYDPSNPEHRKQYRLDAESE